MTEKDKIAQGNDTNRGFCRILPNTKAGGELQMWGTLNVFVIPEIAEGKDCRCVKNSPNLYTPRKRSSMDSH